MTEAHICDECKTVAPIGEAIRWWRLESIARVVAVGEKPEYHFCSWRCLGEYIRRLVATRAAA